MISIPNMAGTGREIACEKIVVKLGSNVVLDAEEKADRRVIEDLADALADLHRRKVRVIVVTSGAIGLGCGRLARQRPKTIPEKQAMAAIGQIGLMHVYQEIFAGRGLQTAQLLLTRADMEDRRRYLNARHALERILELGAVPIINENDTISTDELSFGDNDMLSAYVAVKVKADLLALLTSVEGVMKSPPQERRSSKISVGTPQKGPVETPRRGVSTKEDPQEDALIPLISKIDSAVMGLVDDSRSERGLGGMRSKLEAAKMAADAGVHTVIASGKTPGILRQIASGQFRGTYIPSSRDVSMSALERWIGFGRAPRGRRLTLDDGAVEALLRKKSSLLPVGVTRVEGEFQSGDVVDLCSADGAPVARGLVNYSSEEVEKIKGRKTTQIEGILGHHDYDEIVHRDNLVVLRAG